MGGDGGSIPKRGERVKVASKRNESAESKLDKKLEKWKWCPLSGRPLKRPIVAAKFGQLMTKEGLIEFLIDKKKGIDHLKYDCFELANNTGSLKNMRDVKELTLKDNPQLDPNNTDRLAEYRKGDWACPITGLDTNGKHKFVFSWRCGCVVAERAINECNKDTEDLDSNKKSIRCLVCEKKYKRFDLITINPETHKDLERNQAAFMLRQLYDMQRASRKLDDNVSSDEEEDCPSTDLSSASGSQPRASTSHSPRSRPSGSSSHTSSGSNRNEGRHSSTSKRDRSRTPQAGPSTSGSRSKRSCR